MEGPRKSTSSASALWTILRIGLIAGTLDITDALVFSWFRGVTPTRVFQYIASGLLGPQSMQLGMAAVILGILIHFTIALTWTAIFYVASRKFPILHQRPVISGLLYGAAVYLFMNLVALPLSRVLPRTVTLASRINGVLALLVCIGLTISLLMRRNTTTA